MQEKFADSNATSERAHYLLAVPNSTPSVKVSDLTPKAMGELINYLNDKQGTGLVTLSAGEL